jgi:glutaredoxin
MEARQCTEHGLVAGPDGRCVVCRRGETPVVEPTSSDLPVVVFVVGIVLVLGGGAGYALLRRGDAETVLPLPATEAAPAETPEAEATTTSGGPAAPAAREPRRSAPPETTSSVDQAPPAPTSELEARRALRRKVRLTLYVRPQCELCDRARSWLAREGVQVSTFDVEASPTDKVLLTSINPAGTVPTFDIGGEVLVGYDRSLLEEAVDRAAKKFAPEPSAPTPR